MKMPTKNYSVVLMVVCALTTVVFTASALDIPTHEVESHIRDHVSNTKSVNLEPKEKEAESTHDEAIQEHEDKPRDPSTCQDTPSKQVPATTTQGARNNLEAETTDDATSETAKPAKGLRRIKQMLRPVTNFVSECTWTMLGAIAAALMMLYSLVSWLLEPANLPPKLSGSLPVVGNLIEFVQGPLDLIRRGLKDHGPVFTAKIAVENMTFLIGPEESAVFYRGSDKTVGQAEVYKFMIPIFGKNVLYDCPLSERQQQLTFMGKALLGTSSLKGYVNAIHREVVDYCDKHMSADSGTLNLGKAMGELTLLTASRALLGDHVREHCFEDMASLYGTLDSGLTPIGVIFPHLPIPKHFARNRARKAISALFTRAITARRAAKAENPDVEEPEDLLNVLMNCQYKAGHGNTDDQITGIILGVLFAGHHTSSSTAAWALMMCTTHPNILHRVMAELPEGWDASEPLTYQETRAMPLAHAVVKETLRMYPPLILLMRKVLQAQTVNGYTIPKGHIIVTSPAVSGRLPDVFDDPDAFDPDRFMEPRDEDKTRKFAFSAFGGGIHGCMGQQYGFLQLKIILAVILKKYKLELISPFPEPDYEAMVVGPKGPCEVRYTRQKPGDMAAAVPAEVPINRSEVTKPVAAVPSAAQDEAQRFSVSEVAKHNSPDDAWIVVDGSVYDVTSYIESHPGGNAILENVGGDSSDGFNGPQHPPTARQALDTFYIGELEQEQQQEHSGFGKLILFGEHFVVYKAPALIAAVAACTTARVKATSEPGFKIVDERPAVAGYKVLKAAEAQQSAQLVLDHLKVDLSVQGLQITFGGDLCCVSGIGASAASCVALARALSAQYKLNLTEDEVNAAAYEGEKGYHGTPSGVDNTASTFGGLLRFTRTEAEPLFETKKPGHKCGIVYASTGITASTTEVVGDVLKRKEQDPEWFEQLFDQYNTLLPQAEEALEKGDFPTVGLLLNQNHELCQKLSVSCDELDQLVNVARAAGALGAKMSGTGRGGLMLALVPDEGSMKCVQEALAQYADQVWTSWF